jgi:hypothetical protein
MDGEYYGAENEFNISIGPKKLKVAVPCGFFLIFKRIAFLPFHFRLKIAKCF